VTQTLYNVMGQLVTQTMGNGIATRYDYFANNFRLQRIAVGASLLDMQYVYDNVGNVTNLNDGGTNYAFTYDALNRLLSGYGLTYAYNPIGNITNTSSVGNYTYVVTKPHAVKTAGSNSYTYDNNGNMLARAEGGVTYNHAWDVENRLVSVSATGVSVTFTYDGDGRRVKKTENGVTTIYIGNTYEKNLSTSAVTKYFYLGGKRVAMKQGSTLYYLHGDQLGSTSLTTSVTGTLVASARYDAYGGTRTTSGTTPTDYKFTGQRQEATLGPTNYGLYDYGARFYDPLIGRFIAADTIVPSAGNPQDLNRFSYVRNNPLKYMDPSGHECTKPDGSACSQETVSDTSPTYYLLVCGLNTDCKRRAAFDDYGQRDGYFPLNRIKSELGSSAEYIEGYNEGYGNGIKDTMARNLADRMTQLKKTSPRAEFVLIGHSRGGGDIFTAYGSGLMSDDLKHSVKAIIGLDPYIRDNDRDKSGNIIPNEEQWSKDAYNNGIPILMIVSQAVGSRGEPAHGVRKGVNATDVRLATDVAGTRNPHYALADRSNDAIKWMIDFAFYQR
jgi:RHS repeat-associated protein